MNTYISTPREKPRPYKGESAVTYEQRCQRWAKWLKNEPRPDLWYSSEDEVLAYFLWSGTKQQHYKTENDLIALAKQMGYE